MLTTLPIGIALLALLAVTGGYLLATYVLPIALLRPGRPCRHAAKDTEGNEPLRLRGKDGVELDARFLPARGAARANLIMLHGVGSCKEVYLPTARELTGLGFNVLLWDQRQHGKSGGKYLTYGHHEKEDVSRLLDWLLAKTGPLRTGIYGNSMGGAVAIQSLAHDRRLAFGLIESTFTDLRTVTHAYARRLSGLPLPYRLTDHVLRRAGRLAGFDPFAIRPVTAAAAVTQPVQHIHGGADANIAVSHAHRLFAAYASTDKHLFIVPDGDHADLWEKGGQGYRDVWFGFLRRMAEEESKGERSKGVRGERSKGNN